MTLLRSPRDRSEKYPQPVLRGTQPQRRHGGHFSRLVSGPVHPTLRRWIPDTLAERLDNWIVARGLDVWINGAIFFCAGALAMWAYIRAVAP
jgi:hypothetical protein